MFRTTVLHCDYYSVAWVSWPVCRQCTLQVDIVQMSSVDFQFTPAFDGENQIDAHYIGVFKGFIHPLNAGPNRTAIKLYLIASAAQAYLYMSTSDDPQLKVSLPVGCQAVPDCVCCSGVPVHKHVWWSTAEGESQLTRRWLLCICYTVDCFQRCHLMITKDKVIWL